MKRKKNNGKLSQTFVTTTSVLLSIFAGLLVSFILLYFLEFSKEVSDFTKPSETYFRFIGFPLQDLSAFIKVFYTAAPLILCGLAVGFAFKAGLFNIGIVGQYTMGAFFSLIAVILWNLPWWVAIIIAAAIGAFWGLIPGIFKAKFNINEVITTIMLNWTAVYLTVLMLYNLPNMRTLLRNRTDPIAYHNPSGLLPDLGLKAITESSFINIGIIIAIVFAIIIHVLLNKTTFGFEVKSCGFNRNASKYAGIKEERTIILTFVISGALAGIAGAITYLAGTVAFTTEASLLGLGFNGIPVALLAFSNPLGIIFTGIFVGYLQVGGQAFEGVYSSEVTNIIVSVIIYFSAFTLIVEQFINKKIMLRSSNGETFKTESRLKRLLNGLKNLIQKLKTIEDDKEVISKDQEVESSEGKGEK